MAYSAGDRLGPYEITTLLGKGGMGEVYKAHDSRLHRDVAIKVSAEAFSDRFSREARAIAALNHTNVCHLYDVGPNYLVMEYVEGADLRGPVDFDDALPIIRQLIDGIEAAHEKGIIHRDLKPANIKVTPDGVVKILDFGLARLDAVPSSDPENSPTLSMAATVAGTILGTAAYMSPEQAKGKMADRRSDIWAFGVILFELLTGKRLFQGESTVEILGGMLNKDVDISAAPARVHGLLRWCLEKDRKNRLAAIGDARRMLEEAPVIAESPVAKGSSRLPWIAATVASLSLAAGFAFVHFRQAPPAQQTLRYALNAPAGNTQAALSPDGRFVAISARSGGKYQLWLRALDELDARAVPFTEDARYPFWSPDGRYIGFFAQGKLKKVAVGGGPAQTLCDAPTGRGGSWSRDDVILFVPTPAGGLHQVPANGGGSVRLGGFDGDVRGPAFLPDGRRFLYLRRAPFEKSGIYVGALDGKDNRRILTDRTTPVFAPGAERDHILFARDRVLMALPFDADSAQASGEAFPVTEAAEAGAETTTKAAVSISGMLVYQQSRAAERSQLVWFDRSGKRLGAEGEPGDVRDPALSPDEKRVAFTRGSNEDPNSGSLWVRDLNRRTETKLTTDVASARGPVWSPNGDRLAYGLDATPQTLAKLFQRPADGSGREELLRSGDLQMTVTHWSRDGKFVVYSQRNPPETLWVLPVESGTADRKPAAFAERVSYAMYGQISPDGRWMAFTGRQSGQREVYVRPFPSGDGEWIISVSGGHAARWRADGKELFFVDMAGKIMAVPVKTVSGPKPVFEAGTPAVLFETNMALTSENHRPLYQYDVTADGKRFLVVEGDGNNRAGAPYIVVTNWLASSKRQ